MFDCGDATLSTHNCASDRGPSEILAACDWRGGRCALPTTAILIRARSVVQVHPGPPFKSGPARTHTISPNSHEHGYIHCVSEIPKNYQSTLRPLYRLN